MPRICDADILELVIDYLHNSGFQRSLKTLQEEKRSTDSARKIASRPSKLTDLLEKSYVTELATGSFLPRKRSKRSTLEGALIPNSPESEARQAAREEEEVLTIETRLFPISSMIMIHTERV